MPRTQILFLRSLLACLVFSSVNARTQGQPITIEVLTTYDFPGAGTSSGQGTIPFGINRRGDIAGYYVDSAGATRGFVRYNDGTFSDPIVAPQDTGKFTQAFGINNSRTVDGDFFNVSSNEFHGYFLSGHSFKGFTVQGMSTQLFGINDAGNFVGVFANPANQAFLHIGGNLTLITIPPANGSEADGINRSNQVVGTYTDSSGASHGFFRDANGTLTFPIDVPGATSTLPRALNDKNSIVGRYIDGAGVVHGFLFQMPSTFVTFDYPGALQTSLNGINNGGHISGRYTDTAGVEHGFIAEIEDEQD